MCLSRVYVDSNGENELLMEEVASLKFEKGSLLLKNLFGEEKKIEANVKQIDFMTHSIFLGNLK